MSNDRFKTSEDDYVIAPSPENFVMPLLMDEFYQILSLFKGMSNEDRFKTSEDDYVIVLSPENFVMPLLMDEFFQICHFSKECQMRTD